MQRQVKRCWTRWCIAALYCRRVGLRHFSLPLGGVQDIDLDDEAWADEAWRNDVIVKAKNS